MGGGRTGARCRVFGGGARTERGNTPASTQGSKLGGGQQRRWRRRDPPPPPLETENCPLHTWARASLPAPPPPPTRHDTSGTHLIRALVVRHDVARLDLDDLAVGGGVAEQGADDPLLLLVAADVRVADLQQHDRLDFHCAGVDAADRQQRRVHGFAPPPFARPANSTFGGERERGVKKRRWGCVCPCAVVGLAIGLCV